MDSPLLFPNSLPVFLNRSTYAGYLRIASKVFYFTEGFFSQLVRFFSDSTSSRHGPVYSHRSKIEGEPSLSKGKWETANSLNFTTA